jgi:hypothetical protein
MKRSIALLAGFVLVVGVVLAVPALAARSVTPKLGSYKSAAPPEYGDPLAVIRVVRTSGRRGAEFEIDTSQPTCKDEHGATSKLSVGFRVREGEPIAIKHGEFTFKRTTRGKQATWTTRIHAVFKAATEVVGRVAVNASLDGRLFTPETTRLACVIKERFTAHQ